MAGNTRFLPLLQDYVGGLPDQIVQLREAREQTDHEQLARLSHKLKGSGGSYGYPDITDVARSCEQAAREQVDGHELENRVDALIAFLEAAIRGLDDPA